MSNQFIKDSKLRTSLMKMSYLDLKTLYQYFDGTLTKQSAGYYNINNMLMTLFDINEPKSMIGGAVQKKTT